MERSAENQDGQRELQRASWGGQEGEKKQCFFQRTNSILIMPDLVSCVQIENRRLTWNASSKVRIPHYFFATKSNWFLGWFFGRALFFYHKIKMFFL